MAFPELIKTPVYQQALLTPSVMIRLLANYMTSDSRFLDPFKVREAGLKLDHLMRRALHPND